MFGLGGFMFAPLGWGMLRTLVHTTPMFGGEDPVTGPWHHELITAEAAARAGWSTGTNRGPGKPDRVSAAAALAWHTDYVDSYLYNPLWWAPGGMGRLRAALLAHDHLINVHFDDLTSTRQVQQMWDRYLGGTIAGLMWAADHDDIAAARHIVGVGLHASQDFYSHSNWVDHEARRHATWFQYPLGEESGLYTGTYELPDHLGFKPHGKPAPDCWVLKEFVGEKVMNALCSGFSPLSNTSLCHRWHDCQKSDAGRPKSVAGIEIPDGVYMLHPGIAIDNSWLARIAVTQRDLSDKKTDASKQELDRQAEELWNLTRGLAVNHTYQWLVMLERLMAEHGLQQFWERVKTENRTGERQFSPKPELTDYISGYGPDLDQYEQPSRMLYTFLSAGAYPPEITKEEGWYLRLQIKTSSEDGAGSDADIHVTVNGDQRNPTLLDHMHGRKPQGGGLEEFRPLEYNDFEASADDAYVIGPYADLPHTLTFSNTGATLWDIVEGLWNDLTDTVEDLLKSVRDLLLGLIGGHAEVIATDKRTWEWTELQAIAAGAEGSFALRCARGDEGDFKIHGHLAATPNGDVIDVEVIFDRLECIKESSLDGVFSDSDEPFSLLLVSSPGSHLEIDGDETRPRSPGIAGLIGGPHHDVDKGESHSINKRCRTHVPRGAGLIVAATVLESDQEGRGRRHEMLKEFKLGYSDRTINERSELLDALGRAQHPDWKPDGLKVFAFRRGRTVETCTLQPQPPLGEWIRDGESRVIHLEPVRSRTWNVPRWAPAVPSTAGLLHAQPSTAPTVTLPGPGIVIPTIAPAPNIIPH